MQDLASQAGPVVDVDHYRLAQAARSSYEVVVDAVSGDVQPLVLERLAADTTTVLASSLAVGTGSSRSLRWENLLSTPVVDEQVRVRSGGCTTSCGSEDVYRIRAYETTYTIPRFNNAGTQISVLILQNPTSYTIGGTVYFWSGAGALLHAQPFSIVPKGGYVLSTSTIPALLGTSGTLTVANDGRYGDLVGKAVALEPATGFSFDSPMMWQADQIASRLQAAGSEPAGRQVAASHARSARASRAGAQHASSVPAPRHVRGASRST